MDRVKKRDFTLAVAGLQTVLIILGLDLLIQFFPLGFLFSFFLSNF